MSQCRPFLRASERLRQDRETFDQLKTHDALWLQLRLATGLVAIVALLVVLLVPRNGNGHLRPVVGDSDK